MRRLTLTTLLITSIFSAAVVAGCHSEGSQDDLLLHPARLRATAPSVYDVEFHTTKGNFVVRVTRAWAPRGADRFYNLVEHHFFDGAAFFRVLAGFVAQFGISPSPRIAAAWANATIPDDPVVKSNLRGTLCFATAGPNTRTTQMFINLGNNARLDTMGFSPFGEVIEGMNVVDELYSGYGDGPPGGQGPSQSLISREGSAYLEKDFPRLDRILSARVLPAEHAGR
jgi:peptidyl-prolyl cis-trans isomerase A (cyclophilin A)